MTTPRVSLTTTLRVASMTAGAGLSVGFLVGLIFAGWFLP